MFLNKKNTHFFICLFIVFSTLLVHAEQQCADLFFKADSNIASAQVIAQDVMIQAERAMESVERTISSKKGYAVLIGAMIGSAALTTYVGSQLPEGLRFTSIFIAQVTTLGVYVLGAPIWEPLSSKFRKWAFGMSQDNFKKSTHHLETTWLQTQNAYSLNAQMSRNVISQFLLAVKDNFYQAYRAHSESNPVYAADQVAEAAYRMRILFRDILPSDVSVATAVRSAFTHHVSVDDEFRSLVWTRLQNIDSEVLDPDVKKYYEELLTFWLTNTKS